MGEPQHEPMVEIGKTQNSVELCQNGWDWPIHNDLDIGWIHMHPLFINNLSQILKLGHVESSFLQIGTQIVFLQCLDNMSDVVEVLFPTLAEDQNVIQVYHYK